MCLKANSKIYDINISNGLIFVYEKEVNKTAQSNLLHDILNS